MCRWASQMFCFTHSLLGAPAWTTITHNHKEYVEENTQRVIACFWTIYGKAVKSYHLQHIMDIVKFIWRNQQIQLDCTISCSYRKKLPHTYMHWNPKKGNTESEICHTPLCSWDYITLCCFTHKHAHSHFPAMQGFFWTFLSLKKNVFKGFIPWEEDKSEIKLKNVFIWMRTSTILLICQTLGCGGGANTN